VEDYWSKFAGKVVGEFLFWQILVNVCIYGSFSFFLIEIAAKDVLKMAQSSANLQGGD
jgi:hypothetical protein